MARAKKQEAESPPPAGDNDAETKYAREFLALFEERRALNGRIKSTRKLAKDAGINTRVMEAMVFRRMESDADRENREEFERLRDEMADRLGDFAALPLGSAAVQRAAHA